jgi:YidC/Oxa1 family membrane protein insertase
VIWDALLDGLGSILSFFYQVIPSYGVAIILLTILVRVVLLPLTLKQLRSMQAMQRVQPKVKELQRKYKGNRQKLNEELMKLYKEHQVNPLGGCLPLLLQLPIFFALYRVLSAPIEAVAVPLTPPPADLIQAENVLCQPAGEPRATGESPATIVCDVGGTEETFAVQRWAPKDDVSATEAQQLPFVRLCVPREADPDGGRPTADFLCNSAGGTRHLPREGELFGRVVEDRATFLGMHLACSPTQAASEDEIRICASPGTAAGGFALVGYFGLVALMVATTYYQNRQMQRASAGPQAQQMQLMGRIMPVFLGFISINIATGVLVYWVTTNAWQIGQQTLMLRSRGREAPAEGDGRAPKAKAGGGTPKKGGPVDAKGSKTGGKNQGKSGGSGKTGGGAPSKKSRSRDARGRKKRSKR